MKRDVPIAALRLAACACLRRALTVLVPALILAHASEARALNVYHVPWNATNATQNIKTTIYNAVAPSRIILDYHSTPWYVDDTIILWKNNMEIWFADGAKVMAMAGGHQATDAGLFRVTGNNVTMNGYANGTDTSDGTATLEMRKDLYMDQTQYDWSEGRSCISVQSADSTTIQGLNLVRSGGDGITVNRVPWTTQPPSSNVVIKDVVCDDNYRQGMSVINVDTLTATNCIFKRTGFSGSTPPTAGVDIEASAAAGHLTGIKFINCSFVKNLGNNVEINLHQLTGSGLTPVDITFEGCLMDGGNGNGMSFLGLSPTTGPTGTVLVKNTTIRESKFSGLRFSGWGQDRVDVKMQNVWLIDCNTGSTPPITFTQTGSAVPHGDVAFTHGCHIREPNTIRTTAFVGSSAEVRAAGIGDVTGKITVDRHPSSSGALRNIGNDPTSTLKVEDL